MKTPARTASTADLATAIRQLAEGGTNSAGTVTLVTGATSTPVQNALCTADAKVFLSPRSAPAVAAGAYVALDGAVRGAFTITHAAAAAGCVFDYEIRLTT